MTIAAKIAFLADRLRDISAMGLLFSENIYDRTHYRDIQDIAMQMSAMATGQSMEQLEPLRAGVFSRPTPLAVGDGAVIDPAGRILLIQRADDQKWAMPGGALEVGETPAAGVAREVLEETGVVCETTELVGVFDSRICGSASGHHLYAFTFLCRPLEGRVKPSHCNETVGMGWFTQDALPEAIHPGHAIRIREAYRVWRGDYHPYFDPLSQAKENL